MKIKPLDRTVQQLLEGGNLKIPRFQRPYSWDQVNIEEFWDDAIDAVDPDYFIGSFVVYEESGSYAPMNLVDGQQRITTLTILLSAVRDHLDEIGATELATGVHLFIERPDVNNKLKFVLQTESSYPYLQDHIQRRGESEGLPTNIGPEERALKAAYDFLYKRIADKLSAVDETKGLSANKRFQRKRKRLISIRDKALGLQLILVTLTTQDDAYLIFETLNTRGKDLTVSDLVKNQITRLTRPANEQVDAARDKWDSILELFDTSKARIDINRFLHHYWLSKYPYVTVKVLFKQIKRAITKAEDAKRFLDSLVANSHVYRGLLEPDYRKWKFEEHGLQDSIRAMNIFRVVQPLPILLAMLLAYADKKLTLRQVEHTAQVMEHFLLISTAVAQQRTGGGTAMMYALSARQLSDAVDKNKRQKILLDFVSKLRARKPSFEEFAPSLFELRYSENETKQKDLVHYILREVARSQGDNGPLDYEQMTIEHITPQNPSVATGVKQSLIGHIGNLVLLPSEVNAKLGNKTFEKKRLALIKHGVPCGQVLREATSWTNTTIRKRGEELANLCYKDVFTV